MCPLRAPRRGDGGNDANQIASFQVAVVPASRTAGTGPPARRFPPGMRFRLRARPLAAAGPDLPTMIRPASSVTHMHTHMHIECDGPSTIAVRLSRIRPGEGRPSETNSGREGRGVGYTLRSALHSFKEIAPERNPWGPAPETTDWPGDFLESAADAGPSGTALPNDAPGVLPRRSKPQAAFHRRSPTRGEGPEGGSYNSCYTTSRRRTFAETPPRSCRPGDEKGARGVELALRCRSRASKRRRSLCRKATPEGADPSLQMAEGRSQARKPISLASDGKTAQNDAEAGLRL
jgi:hypothetical protein